MSGSLSYDINSTIGGNPGFSYSRQVGTGLGRALGIRLGPRETSDLVPTINKERYVAYFVHGRSSDPN